MTRYLIERGIAGAGANFEQVLRDASRHSNAVLEGKNPDIQRVHSYARLT